MSEVLKKYLENNSERFSDELLYVVSTAYCKEAALGKTPKNDLYYALLNWRDTHDQVRKNCAMLADTYEVCWYENGQPHQEVFNVLTRKCSCKPYVDARMFYGQIIQMSGVECAELRMCPNEFKSGPERNGRLIASFEKEDSKNG